MTEKPQTETWGCSNPKCGYTLSPSTLPNHYGACPVCGGWWVEKSQPPAKRERKPQEYMRMGPKPPADVPAVGPEEFGQSDIPW